MQKKILAGFLLMARFFKAAHRILYDYPQLKGIQKDFDLVIINDIETIVIAHDIKRKAKLLFDAHEYFPRQFEDKLIWRILFQPLNKYLCKKYLPLVDGMITIGDGIAQEYEKQFGINPSVINNAAPYEIIEPSNGKKEIINLVHHGIAIPSRRLELMIEMMEHLDQRFHLHLMLITPQTANQKTKNYLIDLKDQAKPNPRIFFIDPVKSDEIVTTINRFDVGVILVPPVNFNYKNGLGNKFFDFIQSRLALSIGPIPEMAKLVKQYDLGIVSKDFSPINLAKEMNSLTKEKIDYFKHNSEKAAKEINADINKIKFTKIVNQLTS